MPKATALLTPDPPERLYTRAEVDELIAAEREQARRLVAAVDRSYQEAPDPSLPPRPRLVLHQGGAS